MIQNSKYLLLTVLCLLFAGCSSYNVAIDAIGQKKGLYYVIKPLKEDASSLVFEEFCTYFDKGLLAAGFVKAQNEDNADIVIFADYHVGDGKVVTSSYESPVYGTLGGGYVSTSDGGVVYSPIYGVVGYSNTIRSDIIYVNMLSLSAVNKKIFVETKQKKEEWAIKITCTTYNNDLRKLMPTLVYAAFPYFGKNTGGILDLSLSEDSEKTRSLLMGKP